MGIVSGFVGWVGSRVGFERRVFSWFLVSGFRVGRGVRCTEVGELREGWVGYSVGEGFLFLFRGFFAFLFIF